MDKKNLETVFALLYISAQANGKQNNTEEALAMWLLYSAFWRPYVKIFTSRLQD